jgi:hypothetical protein
VVFIATALDVHVPHIQHSIAVMYSVRLLEVTLGNVEQSQGSQHVSLATSHGLRLKSTTENVRGLTLPLHPTPAPISRATSILLTDSRT